MLKLIRILLGVILAFSIAGCSFGLSGDDGINISGNATSNEITVTLDGSVVRGILADTGNATGSGQWVSFLGSGNVTTSASGNTVVIAGTGRSGSVDMSLGEGHIFVGNTSGLAEDMELSGDATLNGLGELDVTWSDECQSADTANSSTDSDKLDGVHGSGYLLGNATAVDSDKVDGSHASAFLAVAGTAADSDKLDGVHGSGYLLGNATAVDSDKVDGSHASAFLAVAGTAADSDKLDGQHGSYYALACGTTQIVSANVRNSNDAERTTSGTTYVKVKEIRLNASLAKVRVYFEIKCTTTSTLVTGRVYVNAVAVGAEHSTNSQTYQAFTDDLTAGYVANDLIQIYIKANYVDRNIRTQNLRLEYNTGLTSIGGYVLVSAIDTTFDPTISVTNQDP